MNFESNLKKSRRVFGSVPEKGGFSKETASRRRGYGVAGGCELTRSSAMKAAGIVKVNR